MTDTPPNDLIERIIKAARERWPEAKQFKVRTLAWVDTGDVRYFAEAPDLPALLQQLTAPADKGGDDAE